MAAIFDWVCAAHGEFEGPIGKCPYNCGAGMVEKIWKKFPGSKSDSTKTTDRLRDNMMAKFGMTDMQARAGRPAMPEKYRWNQPERLGNLKPYSVPLEPGSNVFNSAGSFGAMPEESSAIFSLKESGKLDMKIRVEYDDKVVVTQKDIQNADS